MAEFVFDQLVTVLKELTKSNPYLEMLNFKNNGEGLAEINSYKDVIYESGARASFQLDFQKSAENERTEFFNEPFEVIYKDRKKDVNIMKGSPLYSRVFDTDMRISINYENKVNFEAIKHQRVKHERIKHRQSF